MDLDKLRLKTSDELNTDEKEFIKQNVDKLDDEDKEAYANFLVDQSESEESPAAGTETPAAGEGSGGNAGAGNGGSQPQTPPATGGYTFKNEDEAKAFVAKTLKEQKEKEEADKQKAIDAAKTPEEKKYVEDNWKPKDWNEALKVATKAAMDAIREETRNETAKQEETRKKFEEEWDGIVEKNKLPKRDTEEGTKILRQVYEIGIKYHQPNFTTAYELWSSIPTDKGGGLDTGKGIISKNSAQRQAAARVAGNTPSGQQGKTMSPKSYQELHGKSDSQLIREAAGGSS